MNPIPHETVFQFFFIISTPFDAWPRLAGVHFPVTDCLTEPGIVRLAVAGRTAPIYGPMSNG
jgi:hypothetical protein